jgi:ECF transporter S component (folate family)
MVRSWLKEIKESANGLKNTRTMVTCAMLLAIEVVINATVSIPIGNYLRISVGYLAVAACGYLYGPSPAMLVAALSDVLVFLIHSSGGAFFPGFTLNAALGGLVYGLAFYRKTEVKWPRILVAQAVIAVFLHVLLNTLWLSVLLGQGYLALLPVRMLKNALQYPVDVALLFFLLLFLKRQFHRA